MIGKFSALAVADTANITSYYNGKKYSYIMYKNGTGINIDLLGSVAGDYKNGVEVSVTTVLETREFLEGLKELVFFPNLHVENNSNAFPCYLTADIKNFNERTIKEWNNFCSCSFLTTSYMSYYRVGNVLYSVQERNLLSDNYGIISFNVGDLDITPNREQIQYSLKSKQNIEVKVKEAIQEYKEAIKKSILLNCDFTDFRTIFNTYICTTRGWSNSKQLLKDTNIPLLVSNKTIIEAGDGIFSIKGDIIPNEILLFFSEKSRNCCLDKKELGFITRKGIDTGSYNLNTFISKKIYLQTSSRLKESTKAYYDHLNKSEYIIVKASRVKEYIAALHRIGLEYDAINYLIRHSYLEKINDDLVPITWLNDYKAAKTNKAVITYDNLNERVNVRNYKNTEDNNGGYVVLRQSIKDLLEYKNTILYAVNTKSDTLYRGLARILENKRRVISIITLPKEIMPKVANKKNWILIDDYLKTRKRVLSKWATAIYLRKMLGEKYENKSIDTLFDTTTYNKFYDYTKSYSLNLNGVQELYDTYVNKRWLDYTAIAAFTPKKEVIELEELKRCFNLYSTKDVCFAMLIASIPEYRKFVNIKKVIELKNLINEKLKVIKNESI